MHGKKTIRNVKEACILTFYFILLEDYAKVS